MRRLLLAALALALLAGAAALGAARWALAPRDPGADERVFVVAPGESLPRIAERLEAEGLVRQRLAVEAVGRWRGLGDRLQRGEYALSPAQTPEEILEQIASGRVLTYEVAFPEGLTAAHFAERLAGAGLADRDAFLAVVRDPAAVAELGVEGASLEGYLFPETYRFPRGMEPLELARAMVSEFRRVWDEIAALARERGLSMRDVVTLASLIEKETGAPDERPLIASVFLNRLRLGMRLETDPSVIYGIRDFGGNLRRRDLEDDANPYNTYRIPGLPPGPIASPGADSLRAVVQPADTKYLYFVSRNDGSHAFSASYEEHVAAVNRYQRNGRVGL
jgi:UPF0755 protein